jgi:hypothetical protein
MFSYLDAEEEKAWGKYRPDVTLVTNDKPIYVEIVVSNPISSDKDLTYFQHRADCLVIDLSKYPKLFSMADLESDVLNNLENRSFLHHYNTPANPKVNSSKTEDTTVKIIVGIAVAVGIGAFIRNKFFTGKKGR